MTISVVIPVFNEWRVTHSCLSWLIQESSDSLVEVIVIDNGSTDETPSGLTEYAMRWPKLKVVTNDKNLGYSIACNQGAAVARGETIAFINNDVRVSVRDIAALNEVLLARPKVAAVMPRIENELGMVDSVGSFLTNFGFLYHPLINSAWDKSRVEPYEVHSLKGAVMLWRSRVFHELGGLDEGFFAYCEETELGFRAITSGFGLLCCPEIVAIHTGSQTANEWRKRRLVFVGSRNWAETLVRHLHWYDLARVFPIYAFMRVLFALLSIPISWRAAAQTVGGLLVGAAKGMASRHHHGHLRVDRIWVPLSYLKLAFNNKSANRWPIPGHTVQMEI